MLVCAALTGVLGRMFGVIELYFITAAMIVAVVAGLLAVFVRRPRVTVRRWVRPEVLTAGDVGRVDIVLRAAGAGWRPSFELLEAVGDDRTARMAVTPMRGGSEQSAGYRVPTERRGVLPIGPLVAARTDVLGVARSRASIAGRDELLVAPRAIELLLPELGTGLLGEHLRAQSVRLGQGEFHSLREYVPGDEPRSIHWKASARSDDLKVRQHTPEGLRRCTVVLDQQATPSALADPSRADDDAFERACVAAASIVHSSVLEGLETRLATTTGIDLRGPAVAVSAMHQLARVEPTAEPLHPVERDPGEGLGLVFVITAGPDTEAWSMLRDLRDPTLTAVGVFTARAATGVRFSVDSRSEQQLLASWQRLVGRRHRRHGRGAA